MKTNKILPFLCLGVILSLTSTIVGAALPHFISGAGQDLKSVGNTVKKGWDAANCKANCPRQDAECKAQWPGVCTKK